jgi:hypothetical protein
MSIKIGFPNNKYNYDNLIGQDNTLIVNSFTNSNVIYLNGETGSTDNIYIRFKNRIAAGANSNTFIIDDLESGNRLMAINNSNFTVNKPVITNDNLFVKNILNTANNTVTINSNLQVNLLSTNSAFTISSNNIALFRIYNNSTAEIISDSFSIRSKTKQLLQISDTNTNINNNVYINNGTLYVNAISSIGNSKIQLYNVEYTVGIVNNFLATRNIGILQPAGVQDITPLEICKRYGNTDIMQIYTSNISAVAPAPKVVYNFMMNKDGLVGLGTQSPDATLAIRTVSQNIINYVGSSAGDLFKMTKYADVGIGTSTPKSQMHIRRNDDQGPDTLRRNPMVYLDMNYDQTKNYSNVYQYYTTNLNDSSATIYTITQPDTAPNSFINSFYLLNSSILQTIDNNIYNMSNVFLPNSDTLYFDLSVPTQTALINIKNTFTYPSSDVIYIDEDDTRRGFTSPANGQYVASYVLFVMTKATKDSGGYQSDPGSPGFNASNFTNWPSDLLMQKPEITVYQANNNTIRIRFDFVFERNAIINQAKTVLYQPITYALVSKVLVQAPNFMNMTYNNNFISSITAEGTLCLGEQVPENAKNRYLLYSAGALYAPMLHVNQIDTLQSDSNISLSNKNLMNINRITANIINSDSTYANTSTLHTVNANNLYVYHGLYSNLVSSNITFDSSTSKHSIFSESNIHFMARVSMGASLVTRELQNSAMLKITTDSNIGAVISDYNIYNRRDGIIITNNSTSGDPSLTIKTVSANNVPYLHLNNSESSYFWRIKKNSIALNNFVTSLELTNDNFIDETRASYFTGNGIVPCVMRHMKEYNLLTLGEQNTLCVDTLSRTSLSQNNTNSTSKISIGIPYGALGSVYAVKDFPKYFVQNINTDNNPYMLNIFGNVHIANINNNPVFTTVTSSDNVVHTGINCHPDTQHTLKVDGNMSTSNITLVNLNSNLVDIILNLQARLKIAEDRLDTL